MVSLGLQLAQQLGHRLQVPFGGSQGFFGQSPTTRVSPQFANQPFDLGHVVGQLARDDAPDIVVGQVVQIGEIERELPQLDHSAQVENVIGDFIRSPLMIVGHRRQQLGRLFLPGWAPRLSTSQIDRQRPAMELQQLIQVPDQKDCGVSRLRQHPSHPADHRPVLPAMSDDFQ